MPVVLLPNSHGESLEIYPWDSIREAWSDAARRAAAEARRRRKVIGRLEKIRAKAMDRLTSQMNREFGMGKAPLHGISKQSASHWKRANDASRAIFRIQAIKPTHSRPLLARFRKSVRSYF